MRPGARWFMAGKLLRLRKEVLGTDRCVAWARSGVNPYEDRHLAASLEEIPDDAHHLPASGPCTCGRL